MAHKFEYEYPVNPNDLSALVRNLTEDPIIGPKFEDFSIDSSIETMPIIQVETRLEDISEEEMVIQAIRRCSYDALSFNITG